MTVSWTQKRLKLFFAVIWLSTVATTGWQLAHRQRIIGPQTAIVGFSTLLPCTALLLTMLENPLQNSTADWNAGKISLAFRIIAAGILIFSAPVLFSRFSLLGLPVVAFIGLLAMGKLPSVPETLYALILAGVAGVAALGMGDMVGISRIQWALVQVLLVSTGLSAGWGIVRRTGLYDRGIGHSRCLSSGVRQGMLSLIQGAFLAVPWALGNVAAGGGKQDAWVTAWWQPLTAAQPAIAEEAWGRMLMVPLLYLFLRSAAKDRTAFTASVILAAYWFAYLHFAGNAGAHISAIPLAVLFALPLSYLCFFRDLETAIGFHFCIDFIRYLAPLVLFRG